MPTKRFWTLRTIAFFVMFLTICSLLGNGIAATAELYVVILGALFTYKIVAKEKI